MTFAGQSSFLWHSTQHDHKSRKWRGTCVATHGEGYSCVAVICSFGSRGARVHYFGLEVLRAITPTRPKRMDTIGRCIGNLCPAARTMGLMVGP
jgi:hypothetical protein